MTDQDFGRFFGAVGAGTLAGTLPWVVFAPLVGLFAFLPVAAAACVGMFVIGLPVTKLLAANSRECPRTYGAIGATSGLILPPLFIAFASGPATMLDGFSLLLAANGALTGGVTAYRWGIHRKRLRDHAAEQGHTPNPIYDLLH